jgi:uncharacterized protein YqeY
MSLSERLQKDLVEAMKARQTTRLSVLRLIKTAIQHKEIDLGEPLTTEQDLQLLQTMVKQRNESISTFEKANRQDLADKEKEELVIVRTYLPEEISLDEVDRVVVAVVEELEASSPKDMGNVMKETMARLKKTGKVVDGKVVNQVVRSKLS